MRRAVGVRVSCRKRRRSFFQPFFGTRLTSPDVLCSKLAKLFQLLSISRIHLWPIHSPISQKSLSCTPCSGVSPSREGRGCTPRTYVSACREDRGCTPRSGFSAFHASIVSFPSRLVYDGTAESPGGQRATIASSRPFTTAVFTAQRKLPEGASHTVERSCANEVSRVSPNPPSQSSQSTDSFSARNLSTCRHKPRRTHAHTVCVIDVRARPMSSCGHRAVCIRGGPETISGDCRGEARRGRGACAWENLETSRAFDCHLGDVRGCLDVRT